MRRHAPFLLQIAALALALQLCGCATVPPPRAAPDPDVMAATEARMWKAYYSGDRPLLGLEILRVFRDQFGLTWGQARRVALRFASAAATFRDARGDYDKLVLPKLTDAYACVQNCTGAGFDPPRAAQAELAWWVARRTPGQNDPENVGRLMATLYATLYGGQAEQFREAGRLRALAAHVRDQGGEHADWAQVQDLLRRSYAALAAEMRL